MNKNILDSILSAHFVAFLEAYFQDFFMHINPVPKLYTRYYNTIHVDKIVGIRLDMSFFFSSGKSTTWSMTIRINIIPKLVYAPNNWVTYGSRARLFKNLESIVFRTAIVDTNTLSQNVWWVRRHSYIL